MNKVYPLYKEAALSGDTDVSLTTGVVKVVLVDTGVYTYSDTHQFYSDLSGVVGAPATMLNVTVTGGVFDGDDVTFFSVLGDSVEALVVYVDTGVPGTSRLFAYIDSGITGLPITPGGGYIDVYWSPSGVVAV